MDEIDNDEEEEEEEEEGRGKGSVRGKKGGEDSAEADGDGKPGGSKFDYETLTDAHGHVWSGVIIDQDVVSHTLPRERLVYDTCTECMYVCMKVVVDAL